MKRAALFSFFLAVVVFSISPLMAQVSQDGMHAPSGGTQTRVISIAVPPLPNAPFTATVTTTWVRALADGSTLTIQNHRTIARDNSGRVFQERRNLYPAGDPSEDRIRQLEFGDPGAHVIYLCQPDARTCEERSYFASTAPAPLIPAGMLDNGRIFLTRIDLGRDTVSGVETVGTRETRTISPGTIGNDRAIAIVKEFWFSPQLGINVIEKREDPRVGTQTFTVDPISLGEPDARLFDIPPDYRVVDQRKASQAGAN